MAAAFLVLGVAAMSLRDEIPPERLRYWTVLVGGAVRVRKPKDVERIAEMCAIEELCGRATSVWHESAAFYGTECHCARCNPYRQK